MLDLSLGIDSASLLELEMVKLGNYKKLRLVRAKARSLIRIMAKRKVASTDNGMGFRWALK